MWHSLLNPIHLLSTFGYLGLVIIILIDCGLPIGIFFPGDSLLISAGILASQGHMNIIAVIIISFVAAVIGYGSGYFFGDKVGKRLFDRPNSQFFSHERLTRAQAFFEKYGAQSIILARFIPFVRTFAPIVAGTSSMPYRKFMTYNVIGGISWAIIVPLLGFGLGRVVPHIDRYLLPVIIVVLLSSFVPAIWHVTGQRMKNRNEKKKSIKKK